MLDGAPLNQVAVARPPHILDVALNQVAVAHIEDQLSTRPFRPIEITANAGCRMLPIGDQLTIDERLSEFFKGRDRRVPRGFHRDRNGSHDKADRPPEEILLRRIQGPLPAVELPGAVARVEEPEPRFFITALWMALHRLDPNDPLQKYLVERP